jgi:hypothetical protein
MRLDPNGPEGAQLLKAEVSDWSATLDTLGIVGGRELRVLVRRGGKDVRVDRVLVSHDGKVLKVEKTGSIGDPAVYVPVTFDNTGPEFITFDVDGPDPKKLLRGLPLPLVARGFDPESGVKEAIFFAGRPTPDLKIPPDAIRVQGEKKDDDTWVAQLPVATDKTGTVDVSVALVNQAGLTDFGTRRVYLVDPPPAGVAKPDDKSKTPKLPIIEGIVYEADRPQPNLSVVLRDAKGVAQDTVTTDTAGRFAFVNVPPGTYRVTAVKTADNTRGETPVTVQEKDVKDVRIRLFR